MNITKVEFHGNVIEAVKDERGECWVSVRSICDGIGVSWPPQYTKIKNDPRYRGYDIVTPSASGSQTTLCLPVNQLNGWLFSINANKVHEDVRPRLLQYQKECMEVLYKHFMPKGERDLGVIMERLSIMNNKLDEIGCIKDTVFGDDQKEIQELVTKVAEVYRVDGRTVWGWVQTECDVSSYKKQNHKVMNFLRNKLGKGVIGIVKEETSET